MFNTPSIALPPPDATLAGVDDVVGTVREVPVGRTRRADVLIGATVPPDVAFPAISLLARRDPAVEVALHCEEHADRLLVEGRADVAFLRWPLSDSSISETVVADDTRVALVPRWHRLARRTQTDLGSYATVAVALADAPPSAILLAHRAVVTSAAAVMFVDAALEIARAQ